jgi:uncharacterized protein YkwD
MRFEKIYNSLLLLSFMILSACSSNPSSSITNDNRQLDSISVSIVVATDIKATLLSHNTVRVPLGLTPLRWSTSLANYAQQWAFHQASTQNCTMQHRPHQDGVFKQVHGENLFWASPKRWSDGKLELQTISITEVIKAWTDEVVDYNYANNSCRLGTQCGHYTQVVWQNTQKVGCAVAICPNKSQLWVCNYDPAGNYIGVRPY